jgi:hypothetical protein
LAVFSNCHCDSAGQQSALWDDDLSSAALAKGEAIQPAIAPASFGAAAVARRAEAAALAKAGWIATSASCLGDHDAPLAPSAVAH